MKRLLFHIVAIFAVASVTACAGANTTDKGPKISADVDSGFTTVSSRDLSTTPKTFKLDAAKTAYEVTISVDTVNGDSTTVGANKRPDEFPAQIPTVVIAVDGVSVPTPELDPAPGGIGTSVKSKPFTIPGTSKGKTLTIHIEAQDSRGLKSNELDFKIPLE